MYTPFQRYNYAQGRCITCNVLHTWPRKGVRVSDAKCPTCGFDLARTTGQIALRLPTLRWDAGLGNGTAVTLAPGEEARMAQAYYASTRADRGFDNRHED